MSVAKRLLRVAGSALSIACIAWIAWNFYSTGLVQQLAADGNFRELRWRVLRAVSIYTLAVVVLGVAWAFLQRVFVARAAMAPAVATYLVTQAYKYLPGGVLQYVGRHAALRKQGMTHASLAMCALAEAGCLVAVASAASASFATHLGIPLSPEIICGAILGFLCVAIVGLGLLRRHVRWLRERLPAFNVGWLACALGLYAIFFLLMALTLVTVVPPDLAASMPITGWAGVAAASWIAGFVVIGAPAGLGVREAVFVVLLAGIASRPSILLLAACFRIATFGGDVMAYIAGWLLNKKTRP